jgi:hypothetical protein
LFEEIATQARHLTAARLDPEAAGAIAAEMAALARMVEAPARPPRTLITFDAHPGNFLIRPDGRAILVDLEKARYAYPPLDLAHATLYTSTTWDVASSAVLAVDDTAAAHRTWTTAMGAPAAAFGAWHVPLRRAMWLWSVTWCAKWRALSGAAVKPTTAGEDWSAGHSEAALVAHVRDRVDHYLSTQIIRRMRDEFAHLDAQLSAPEHVNRSSS